MSERCMESFDRGDDMYSRLWGGRAICTSECWDEKRKDEGRKQESGEGRLRSGSV